MQTSVKEEDDIKTTTNKQTKQSHFFGVFFLLHIYRLCHVQNS